MKRIDYVRQLPGMKSIEDDRMECPFYYGLDNNFKEEGCPLTFWGYSDCAKCANKEATINGEPAPYLFACPVKPGQTVYRANRYDDDVVENLVCKVGFTIYGMVVECDYWFVFHDDDWLVTVFPTREEAEAKMAEMRGDDGQ